MSDLNSYGFGQTGSISAAQVRNRVLRNTYALLALSMVPTVIGAWLGVALILTASQVKSLENFRKKNTE